MGIVLSRFSTSGLPDPTFGTNGKVMTDLGMYESITAIALQPDGRIVVLGRKYKSYEDFRNLAVIVVRYNADGTVDPVFVPSGDFVSGGANSVGFPRAVALQPDGKIVLVGDAQPFAPATSVVRLMPDGTLDPDFRRDNFPADVPGSMYGPSIGVQSDGGILVAGTDPGPGPAGRDGGIVVRLTPAGWPDLTYGSGGVARISDAGMAVGMVVQPDDKVVIAESSEGSGFDARHFSVARLTRAGQPDPSFGSGGRVTASIGNAQNVGATGVALGPGGKIVVGGWVTADPPAPPFTPSRVFVAQLTAGGTLDSRFGSQGVATYLVGGQPQSYPAAVQVGPDGRPILVGHSKDPTSDPTSGAGLRAFVLRSQAPQDPPQGWGWNVFGQLGDGSVSDASRPRRVTGLANMQGLAGGATHSLALGGDGKVTAWGWNGFGQSGDGSTTERHTATPVRGLNGVVAVGAGAYHSVAIKADRTVWSWGWNRLGQLGDGSTADRSTPVPVAGLDGVVDIAAGAFHSLAVKADGTVWTWGSNVLGQLGDGTTTDRQTPVVVEGLNDVVAVAGGLYHSLAVKADGTLWSWGWNGLGQLGDGTTTDHHTPGQVVGVVGVGDVVAGAYSSTVLNGDGLGIQSGAGRRTVGWGSGRLVPRRLSR